MRGSADPTPDTANRIAHSRRTFLRPKRSLRNPANAAPGMQPTIALAPAQPVWSGVSEKCPWIDPIAPEMTAVS